MPEKRPDPEKLLKRIQNEGSQRGKLKIYLGAAPGVGKTYSMLQDARAKREQGLDVVAGVVESHGRKDIDELLKSIEVLPRKMVDYHGRPLLEFDLDAALLRAPALILIDEMAHQNVPGLRHAKRWQDIKELIDRGINVYTTLNVQHIESLNDVIAQIVGVRVRETVPDYMLTLAGTIELVDLPPDDLLKRLEEGKVYIPAQAELATQHFFRKGNLIALRELALRYTAERVDEQVLLHRQGEGIQQTWPTMERLLVCVGPDPASSKLIRVAKRMAMGLHAAWICIHVEAPSINLTSEQRNSAIQNIRLAEQLGADTRILTGVDIVKEIIAFAREHNVTKILIGKQNRPRWKEFLFKNLANELIRQSREIDVYIVTSEVGVKEEKKFFSRPKGIPWQQYFTASILVGIALLIDVMIHPILGTANSISVLLLAIILVSSRGQQGPAIFAALLSGLAYSFLFLPSFFNLSVSDIQYVFTFLMMIAVAKIISHLSMLNKQQAEIALTGEQRTAAVQALTKQLATTRGSMRLLETAIRYISQLFDSEVMALLPEENEIKTIVSSSSKNTLNAKDKGVAQWVFDLGQVAGIGTDTLPFSDSLYVPLHGSQGPIGVLRVRPRENEQLLIPEQIHLLETCANQLAMALEVDRLQEKARESQAAIETERLRKALFHSLSQELQTPLAVMARMINKLRSSEQQNADEAKALINNIHGEAEQLNRLINNLLQITRLEEGKIRLNKHANSLAEIIEISRSRLEKKLENKKIVVSLDPDLPLIPFDKVLMEQVMVNLIENAVLYTPMGTSIEISAKKEINHVLVSVTDHGPGLMITDLDKIFEKFYRGQAARKEFGSGLGLSVCQSIIKAHGGRIWAENGEDGGAIFYFELPLHTTTEV